MTTTHVDTYSTGPRDLTHMAVYVDTTTDHAPHVVVAIAATADAARACAEGRRDPDDDACRATLPPSGVQHLTDALLVPDGSRLAPSPDPDIEDRDEQLRKAITDAIGCSPRVAGHALDAVMVRLHGLGLAVTRREVAG